MPEHTVLNAWLRCSRYYLEGEDVGRAGGTARECRYYRGSIAFSEWTAGFKEGCAAHFDLTDEMRTPSVYSPNSGPSPAGSNARAREGRQGN